MNSGKYIFDIKPDFSLRRIASGIERILESYDMVVYKEEPSYNTMIISGSNVTGVGSRFWRNISGTVRSISVYLEENDGKLSVYFDNRAWDDKACGFLLGIFAWPVFFTSCYGTARQLHMENEILGYIEDACLAREHKGVNFESMNTRQRIMLATPIISLIIFLTMGYVWNMWGWGALAFLLIPLMPIILGEISVDFIFPFIVTAVYLGLGFGLHLWHPAWILFLTIPVYFIIFPAKHRPIHYAAD